MERKSMKFGVYLPEEMAKELEDLMKAMNIDRKSKLVQEGLRLFLLENQWYRAKSVAGSIGVLYDHEVGGVDEALTNVQHEYMDIISSSLHVHLDERKCMLIIAVRGSTSRVREFAGKLHSIRGVLLVRYMLLSLET